MPWVRACNVGDLVEGEGLQLKTTPLIAVFNVDGEFFAVDDTCTHDNYSLADGYIEGDQVECGWHFAKFCLRTGSALSLPASRSLRSYPVRTEGTELFVDLPSIEESTDPAESEPVA